MKPTEVPTNPSELRIRFGSPSDVKERDERFVRDRLVNKLDGILVIGDGLETFEDGWEEGKTRN